jgi:predicted membrane channel-forming protein YqfA (hemolysin III family)
MGWIIEVGDGSRTHILTLKEALRQGFSLLTDSQKMTLHVPFNASGITHYAVGIKIFYSATKEKASISKSKQDFNHVFKLTGSTTHSSSLRPNV